MRILVTGGGLIGGAIAAALANDHDVTVFDVAPPESAATYDVITGDVRDPDSVAAACASMDRVIHTAALHGIHLNAHPAHEFMDINVTGTFNVLAGAEAAGVRRVVISSSTAVFGGHGGSIITDDLPPLGGDIYGMTKVFDELLGDYFTRARGLEVVALRYGAVWQLVCEILRPDVKAALGGNPDLIALALSGGVTDVRDAVTANVAAALHDGPLSSVYTVLPTTLFDKPVDDACAALAARLPDVAGHLPDTVSIGRPFDASRTERELGIEISHGQDEFLRDALALLK